MILYNVERVRDKDGKSTHAATITTDSGSFHTEFFPCIFVGMEFEKEKVMIGGHEQECFMPTSLGACENKRRYRAPVPKRNEEEKKDTGRDTAGLETDVDDVVMFDLERIRRETIFYYCVKDILDYSDIVRITYAKKMGGFKDIYEKYLKIPYALICEMTSKDGDYFHKFPQVAKLQIPQTFEERLTEYRYGARYILHHMESSGNTWMPYGEFRDEFLKLFKGIGRPMRNGNPRAILEHFEEFTIDPVISKDAKVFRTETKLREMDILSIVDQYRKATSPYPLFSPIGMEDFEEEQRDAVKGSIISKGRLSIITGGPGVGKTTVLKKIIDTMKEQYPDIQVRFLASTGKAANRIKETLGEQEGVTISTVHKFLGWGANSVWDQNKAVEIKESGLVIVDESSMMDLYIFSTLLNALDMQKTKVILVGDCDQLPSVEAGNILSDMIALKVPTFYLTKNHRNNGAILDNAKKIISGDPFLKEDEHFKIVDAAPSIGWMHAGLCISDAEKQADNSETKRELAAFSPYKTDKIDGSTGYINKMVQESIFKTSGPNRPTACFGYYIGDRVVFTRTDYAAGYFNGDLGVFLGWRNGHYIVSVGGERKTVVDDNDIDLAYSLTIHKSQGSEYDEVLISIPKYTPFITRRMLYTAVTRARDKVTIFASKDTVRRVVMNNTDRNRRTFLSVVAKERE